MTAPLGLIGHEDVLAQVRAYAGHALLLAGPARVGKRPLARAIAALVNCGQPDAPCGRCTSCLGILRGAHPDLLEVEPRATTSTGKAARRKIIPLGAVLEERDKGHEFEGHILEFAEVRATYARRVIVIDGAEFLTDEAANALLKLVEEPPHATLFVFLTEDLGAVLPTIVSRCGRLNVRPVDDFTLEEAMGRLGASGPDLLAFASGRPGVVLEHDAARAALDAAHDLTNALDQGLLSALEAAEALEKRFDPLWHPEALRFVWRDRPASERARADAALERALAALEQYVSPSLVFQVLALDLREAFGLA